MNIELLLMKSMLNYLGKIYEACSKGSWKNVYYEKVAQISKISFTKRDLPSDFIILELLKSPCVMSAAYLALCSQQDEPEDG